ncbi:MAG: tetratricopeptide repeat protein [Treponema sp.]|nr:tetratricopeptide repeat protein [Treponema sp.]
MKKKRGGVFAAGALFIMYLFSYNSCASFGASPEEYYSIGMAYFELGKFEEAERWLNRAKAADKTKIASEYNLGRIAFETGRYGEAAAIFDRILARDPNNTMALKAAAYTRIKTGELEKAEQYYQRILALIPESADDGYNYALVLFAIKKFEETENTLLKNPYALEENKDALLLYARAQKAQGKVEAVDTYAKFLLNNSDPKARYEYAQTLEAAELYAKAIEEYRAALNELSQDSADLKRQDIRFGLARALLIADGENPEGLTELEGAVSSDFTDIEALENLAADEKLSPANRERIQDIISKMKQDAAEDDEALETEAEAGSDEPKE